MTIEGKAVNDFCSLHRRWVCSIIASYNCGILLILTKTPVCGCRMYRGNVHVLKENAVVFSNGSVIPQVNIKNEYTCKHRKRVMSITYLCYMGSSVK